MKKVTITQDQEKIVPVEVLAQSILSISEGIKKLRSTKLNDKALFLLIQNNTFIKKGYASSKCSMVDVKAVIESIETLATAYLKK